MTDDIYRLTFMEDENDSTSSYTWMADFFNNALDTLGITASTLFNALPYPAVFFDAKGNVREYNTSFLAKFGRDLYNNPQNIHSFLNQIISMENPYNKDFKATYRGKIYWSHMIELNYLNKKMGSILLLRDMSRVEKAFIELAHVRSLNDQLDRIINASFDGFYITDGQGVTLRINKAFERITGVTASECLGRSMHELVAEGYFSRSGTLLALEQKTTVTVPLQARSGKSALVTSTPIFDDEGNIVLVVTNVRDMTELVELEQKLERVEGLRQKQLAAIIDSSYDGLYITDGQAVTLHINKAFERITGVTAEECLGRSMHELVAEGYFSRSGTLLALEHRKPVTVPLQAKTGKHALVTSTPVFDDDGNIILVVTNVRDLTELNQLKQKVDDLETLSKAYHVELQQMRMESAAKYVFNSAPMRDLMRTIIHVSSVESTVLIQGESGSGKEVVADMIHYHSPRRDMPFIKINCAAIPQNLLESELFGYEPGAFSGADRRGKPGIFELANHGTLFLDEISELPLDLQAKLLRVLQDQKVMRIGGTEPIQVDVRIIAGSNVNLWEMVQRKLFRTDLFFRFNVVPIYVPPLRERIDDIPVLCAHFLDMFNKKYNLNKRIAPEVLQAFVHYDWPGNVRELRNLIERLVVTTMHDLITLDDLSAWSTLVPGQISDGKIPTLQEAIEETERKLLVAAFHQCKTTYEVAELLGISQASVVRKAKKLGILRKTRKTK
ncbi:MAG TPA: sigma 54-interacting transcriptional regulator [Syntrophomonadaceae bacterium]|nr:sigma 54-interacting transcriptional regulator [Syntrophomonadaceae bacterium]